LPLQQELGCANSKPDFYAIGGCPPTRLEKKGNEVVFVLRGKRDRRTGTPYVDVFDFKLNWLPMESFNWTRAPASIEKNIVNKSRFFIDVPGRETQFWQCPPPVLSAQKNNSHFGSAILMD
jgi:hypothetical protein